MAFSSLTYTGDGVTVDYAVTFDYLDQTHISVLVDKVRTTAVGSNYAFEWINANTVRVRTVVDQNPVPAGLEVVILRETPINVPAVIFGGGASLTSENLNKNSNYLTYALQEATDANDAFTTLYLGSKSAAPTVDNAGGVLQIGAIYFNTNDNTPYYWTGSQWNKGDIAGVAETFANQAETARAAAVAAQAAAETAETGSVAARTAAQIAQTASETAQAAAEAAQTAAETAQAAAETARSGAETAETNAGSSASDASTSASSAQSFAFSAATAASDAASEATDAASSASAAATSASDAAAAATSAATSESNAASSAAAAAQSAADAALFDPASYYTQAAIDAFLEDKLDVFTNAQTGDVLEIGTDDQARYVTISGGGARFGYDGSEAVFQGGTGSGIKFETNGGDLAIQIHSSRRIQTLGTLDIDSAVTERIFNLTGTTPLIQAYNGTIITWTLTGNSNPTTNLLNGQSVTLMVADGTSAFTVDWSSVVGSWVGGAAPDLPETGFAVITLWAVDGVVHGAHMGDTA